MKTKHREQSHSRYLRSVEGRSIKEIAGLLGVSQASASVWVRDIALTDAQRAALLDRTRVLRSKSRAAFYRERRLECQHEGRARAREANARHVAGCMLYWSEGSKSRNAVQFVNSDPAMVRFFVDFLRAELGIRNDAFKVDCNLFSDHREHQEEIERFWLDTLQLPCSCLRKSTVNVYSKYSQRKRQGRLPYGTVRVVVHSTRVVQHIYGAIQEYGGFERPEWLD